MKVGIKIISTSSIEEKIKSPVSVDLGLQITYLKVNGMIELLHTYNLSCNIYKRR